MIFDKHGGSAFLHWHDQGDTADGIGKWRRKYGLDTQMIDLWARVPASLLDSEFGPVLAAQNRRECLFA
jgi:hypothetical protein